MRIKKNILPSMSRVTIFGYNSKDFLNDGEYK